MDTNVPIVKMRNITKRFGSKVVANDKVWLDIYRGEILSILGENIAKDAQGYTFDKKLLADDQPDVIILNSDVPESEVLSDGVLGSLDAALNGRIIVVSNSYFESPSGRITGLLEELSEGRE